MEYHFLCRVLRVQNHKCSTFLYVAGFEHARQLLIESDLCGELGIGSMSVIKGACRETKNNAGKTIYEITAVDMHVKPAFPMGYRDNYTNKGMAYKACRNEIVNSVLDYLRSEGFQAVSSPFTMPYRGTSTAAPLKISGQFVERYGKITHEFGIKKAMSELLCPVYEIGYVARDMYNTMVNWFEYNILEFVSPVHDITFIEQFIQTFLSTASRVADQYGIRHYDFSGLKVIPIDHQDTWNGIPFAELRKNEKNAIFLNAPVQSPLVKCHNGRRSETIWVFHGESMAHGYRDENDWKTICDFSLAQQKALREQGIQSELSEDFLEVLQLGIPDSVSLGIGIDRFFQQFFLFPNLKEYHKFMD